MKNPGLLLLVLLLAGGSGALDAQSKTTRESPVGIWKDESNFRAVQRAWERVANEQYAEAERDFAELVDRIKEPYERSQAMLGLAQAQMAQDRFDAALALYEQIVEMDVLPNKPHFDAMFQIGQLYYLHERYDEALAWVDRWARESGDVRIEAYELKASIHAQREDYGNALINIDQAIALADRPKETWYQLKLAMHYERKEYVEAKEALEIMVRNWPGNKQYWTQLSHINVTLKRDQEALAVMALAHRQGLLTHEQDYVQMYSLYGYMEIPFKAAEILAEGIGKGIVEPTRKHWEQLGNAWYAARELDRAVEALGRAAEMSLDGRLDMQVAYILVDQEDWAGAKASLAAAIDKGGLSDTATGNLYVLLGMSELNTGNRDAARQAFLQARQYQRSRASAQQWLNHLEELAKGP